MNRRARDEMNRRARDEMRGLLLVSKFLGERSIKDMFEDNYEGSYRDMDEFCRSKVREMAWVRGDDIRFIYLPHIAHCLEPYYFAIMLDSRLHLFKKQVEGDWYE